MRADPNVKAVFEQICDEIGLSVNAALNIFVKRVVRDRKIPLVEKRLLYYSLSVFPAVVLGAASLDVSTGRQLFVDDYLIAQTNGVVRHWNAPVKEPSPLIQPMDDAGCTVATDGGLWWDPTIRKFRLWYETDWCGHLRYAESDDGLAWQFPDLGIVKGTNRVFAEKSEKMDSWSVFPDYTAENPYAAWWLYVSAPGGNTEDTVSFSTDGRRFERRGVTGLSGDRSSLYYDPFRGTWVYSLRSYWGGGRSRRVVTSADILPTEPYTCDDAKPDGVRRLAEKWDSLPSVMLYNFTAVAYESLMLGVMETFRSPKKNALGHMDNDACEDVGLPKHTHLRFAFSRDGRNFAKGGERCAIYPEEWGSGKWDTGYLAIAGGICVIRDERLWFYYSGFRGDGTRTREKGFRWGRNGMYRNGSIGVASLRRDGFAGMVADGEGTLTTKPLKFTGSHLFVNAECRFGAVSAEILDADGKVLPGFGRTDCTELACADATRHELKFKGGDLAALGSRNVSIRFHLRMATLYAFWLSPSSKGESHGYVAAGGPAYPGLRDL